MVHVELNPTPPSGFVSPSQQIVQDANRVVRISDPLGRTIGIRRLALSKRLRVISLLGRDAQNETILNFALGAAAVVEIDGEPVAPPVSQRELEALWDRLDDPGMVAVAETYAREFAPKPVGAAEIKNG